MYFNNNEKINGLVGNCIDNNNVCSVNKFQIQVVNQIELLFENRCGFFVCIGNKIKDGII